MVTNKYFGYFLTYPPTNSVAGPPAVDLVEMLSWLLCK